MSKIILLGYSGHAKVVADAAISKDISVIGYCDIQRKDENPLDIEYYGYEEENSVITKIVSSNAFVFPAIGSNKLRKKALMSILSHKVRSTNIFHKSSIISQFTQLASNGIFVGPGAIINAGSTIGQGTILNSSSIVEHDCFIGNFSHLAPGAVLLGGVSVGAETLIGANSVVKEGVKIGNKVIIGAGSVIVSDVRDAAVIYGNPGRIR